ncbi:hypothetical protein BZA77DRAFT_324751, partial [Pyronema omphalodes]
MILGFCLFLTILATVIIIQIIFSRQVRQQKQREKLNEALSREKPKPINPEARPWTVSSVSRTQIPPAQDIPPIPSLGSRPGTALSRFEAPEIGFRLSIPRGRASTLDLRWDEIVDRPVTAEARGSARGGPGDV